jgi:glycosyltransferase involved in cell wall biosynthesis
LRLFWTSNAPWVGTGYGQQTALFAPRLKALGHDLALMAFYGLNGRPMEWEGLTVYPGGIDSWGNDVLAAFAAYHFGGDPRGGWTITLQDAWTLEAPALRELRLASWVPIDHDPAPPAVVGYFQKFGAVAIAMSEYGQRKLAEQDIRALYVPHGVDTNVYQPAPDRASIRESLGIPERAFVAGMVAANKGTSPPRKAFAEVFEAFGLFRRQHPDALLYMHTLRSAGHMGCDLRWMAIQYGIEDAIVWADQFRYMAGLVTTKMMAALYSMMDVLVNPSYGEGFGVPIVEAQACGTPVIVADNTSMPELCGSGWVVPTERLWDERHRAFQGRPVVPEIVKALEKAAQPSGARKRAREFALRYDVDLVTERYWVPALAELQRMTEDPVSDARPVDLASIGAE